MDSFFVYLLLITIVILLGLTWLLFRDVVSPSFVTLIMFFISVSCFVFRLDVWELVFTLKAYSLMTISFMLMIFIEYFFRNSYFVNLEKRYEDNVQGVKFYIPNRLNFLLLMVVLFATMYYVFSVYKGGTSLGAVGLNVIGVYKESGIYNLGERVAFNLVRFLSYLYAFIMFQNIVVFGEKITENKASVLAILSFIICSFFYGQRALLITYVIGLVVIFVIFVNNSKRHRNKTVYFKFLKKMTFISTGLFSFLLLTREIVKGRTIETNLLDYILYYFGSTTALFGRIVENPDICHTGFVGYFGEKTFNGFYRSLYSWGILGDEPCDRVFIKMGGLAPSYQAGNEFTYFCGPYIDFGYVGCIIFISLMYIIFCMIYYKFILKRRNGLNRCWWCIVYAYLYTIIALSFYMDNIRSFARPITIMYFFIIWLIVRVCVKRKIVEFR